MKSVYSVIMAGGVGSRFWPLSRNAYPKQFLDILGTGRSLLQMTYERLLTISNHDQIIVVTHQDYFELVSAQLPNLPKENILLEPLRKNTAPCILYAAKTIQELNPDAIMFVAPSDHLIINENQFTQDFYHCLDRLEQDNVLMTMGIFASRPDTGYGYIRFDQTNHLDHEIYKVEQFVEKPDHETALKYMHSGNYLWNSGMFLWPVKTIIEAYKEYASDMYRIFFNDRNSSIQEIYSVCETNSVDYLILENYPEIFVKKVDFGWSDLGTWGSLYTLLPYDQFDNAILKGQVHISQSEGCMIYNGTNQLLAIHGIEDFIIINTPDALLICPKNEEQMIKKVVHSLDSNNQSHLI